MTRNGDGAGVTPRRSKRLRAAAAAAAAASGDPGSSVTVSPGEEEARRVSNRTPANSPAAPAMGHQRSHSASRGENPELVDSEFMTVRPDVTTFHPATARESPAGYPPCSVRKHGTAPDAAPAGKKRAARDAAQGAARRAAAGYTAVESGAGDSTLALVMDSVEGVGESIRGENPLESSENDGEGLAENAEKINEKASASESEKVDADDAENPGLDDTGNAYEEEADELSAEEMEQPGTENAKRVVAERAKTPAAQNAGDDLEEDTRDSSEDDPMKDIIPTDKTREGDLEDDGESDDDAENDGAADAQSTARGQDVAAKEEAVRSTEMDEAEVIEEAGVDVVDANMKDAQSTPRTSASMLDQETLQQAAAALLAYREKVKTRQKGRRVALCDEDDMISVVISLKRAPRRTALKPRAIPLVHPLYKTGEDDVCLFVKDPQRLVKDHLADRGVTAVTKVLGVTKLEKRYGTYEAKRELVQMYDLFLVDDRVLRMMPRLLGNAFVRAKKMPLVVRMDRDVPSGIAKAMAATSFAPSVGTTCAIRVARATFTVQQIVENVEKAMSALAELMPNKWSAFQALYLKSVSSPALPIFISLPTAVDFEKTPEEAAASSGRRKKRRRV